MVIRLRAYAVALGGCKAFPAFGAFGHTSSVVSIVGAPTRDIGMTDRTLANIADDQLWQMYVEHGCNASALSETLGTSGVTTRRYIRNLVAKGYHLSPGARDVVRAARLSGIEAQGGWLRNYDDDGRHIGTTRWAAVDTETMETVIERMRDAFNDVTPLKRVEAPDSTHDDLCNVLPLYDVHWGMAAWGAETGHDDYDLELATDDLMLGMEAVLSIAPQAKRCVLLLGGDLLHADDNKAQTPGNHHPLDVSARMFKVTDSAIAIIKYAVTRALEHHDEVVIKVLRGNHDPNSHRAIAFALREWCRDNDRITIDMDPREIFMMQWGRAAIFGQHGDKMKPINLALKLSDICSFWSECRHRYAYTGHLHSLSAERIGGLNWERLEPFAPSDVYGSSWVNRRAMKIDTYHKMRGRIATAIDPLERD